MDDLIEQMAEVFHAAAQEHPGCVAFDWGELSDEHRAWKVSSMRAVFAAMKAQGFEVVKPKLGQLSAARGCVIRA